MGELYYNWEMYGRILQMPQSVAGEARLGWYWVGDPNLNQRNP